MAAVDYEAEYNNRARVPEHPAIFARWQKDAAAYREATAATECAALGLSYGPSARQTIDLFFPDLDGTTPLALFIHGGYWRSLEPALFSHMARGLNARGVTVGVAGYDLCPTCSVADIITQIQRAVLFLSNRFKKRITIYGHSAGGHLAACMLTTDWKALDAKAMDRPVTAAYSVSGVFDLTPLVHVSMNQDLRLDEAQARAVSPVFWPISPGKVFDAVVGGDESTEFLRQSKTIAEAWQGRAEVRYEEIPGANHFAVIDPLSDPDSKMVERLAQLCERTESRR